MLGGGGTIDLARISAFSLTSYGGESSMLLSLPYTFVSRDHFWNFATSDLAKQFLLEPSENGSGVSDQGFGDERTTLVPRLLSHYPGYRHPA